MKKESDFQWVEGLKTGILHRTLCATVLHGSIVTFRGCSIVTPPGQVRIGLGIVASTVAYLPSAFAMPP